MSQDIQLQESVMIELGWEPSIDAAHIGVTAREPVDFIGADLRGKNLDFAAPF